MNNNLMNQNVVNNMMNTDIMNNNDKNKEIYEDILNLINIRKNKFENNNQNEEKININFYNNLLFINLDLRISISQLIENFFDEIFGEQNKIIKRQNENQTTEDVIKNPIIEYKRKFNNNNYSELLFLEYKGKNLIESINKNCKEIGLKNGEIIFLKIKEFEIMAIYRCYSGLTVKMGVRHNEKIFDVNRKIMKILGMSEKKALFICNAQIIKNSTNTFGELSSKNTISIAVNDINNLIGAGSPPIDFVDVSSKIVKKLNFSKDAPRWREVCKGLNIFGICPNKKCSANGKEVIYKTILTEEGLLFCLNDEIVNIRCPLCNKIIDPKTCGFWQCEYQFKGKKIEDGEEKEYDSKTKETNYDDFEYFDPYENGKVRWTLLNIFVLPKQHIKYKHNNKQK